ncbi:MAG: fibronectin type III domain-containing protein, partial [bacterium]
VDKATVPNTSAVSTGLVVKTLPVTDTIAPTVPTAVTSSAVTQTTATLSWTASTDASGIARYNIYKNGVILNTSTTNTYSVTGLTANTSYTFTVSAVDKATVPNTSAVSTGLVVRTLTTTTTNPPGSGTGGGIPQ